MARIGVFTFRVNDTERKMIALLAERLQRSQSDAVRLLIREAARELEAQNQTTRVVAAQGVGGGGHNATAA